MVGYWSDGISSHGFLDVGGVITPINDPNAGVSGTVVKYINNDGQIAGYYTDANNVTHGFLYDHGTFTDIVDPLASPDGYNTHIYGISDAGVFGSYSNATGNHGFIYKDGVYTTVDDHTASSSEVVAMSDLGQLILMIRNGFVESIEIGTLQVGTPVNPTVVADHDHANLYQPLPEDAAHGVLANDTDPIPKDVLSVTAVNGLAKVGTPVQGLYGALTLAADGSYAYTATGVLPGDGVGFDTFSYTATEKAGGQATTDLTIVVVSGGLHYLGGTPNATINGGVYINLLDGSQGHDVLIAGSYATVEIGGPGDTLTGSNMADKFVFHGDFGHNEITNFNPKNDTIWLDHTEFTSYQQVLDHATQVGTGHNAMTIINDGKGDVIQLDHVQLSALHASDFYFL